MRFAAHLLSGALLAGALLGSSASCGGPGAGISSFSEGDVKKATGAPGTGDDDDTKGTSSSSSSGAAKGDPIFGTSAFAFIDPGQNANDHAATHAGQTPLEGKNCVVAGCHLDAKPWAAAGTVYADVNGAAPAGQVEIGILYPDNTVKSAFTDKQGNFWFDITEIPPAGSKVAVRINGGVAKMMNAPLTAPPGSQACNSATGCHGSPTLRIWIK